MKISTPRAMQSNFIFVVPLLAAQMFPFALAASPAATTATPAAKSAPATAAKTAAKKPAATTANAGDILKADQDGWKVLDLPLVKQAMKTVMGNKYPLFEQQIGLLNETEIKGDEISSAGGVEGLFTIQEGAYAFNKKTQRIQVALLDNDTLDVWGAASKKELSPAMKAWVADLNGRKSGSVSFEFEAPNHSSIALMAPEKKGAKKNLNTKTPTGTYERKGQWDQASLEVIALPGNKLKFNLSAMHQANTGEASGTIELKNNRAIYKDEYFTLQFDYKGNSFEVSQTAGGPFGGMNVTADGHYQKTNDAKPTIND